MYKIMHMFSALSSDSFEVYVNSQNVHSQLEIEDQHEDIPDNDTVGLSYMLHDMVGLSYIIISQSMHHPGNSLDLLCNWIEFISICFIAVD